MNNNDLLKIFESFFEGKTWFEVFSDKDLYNRVMKCAEEYKKEHPEINWVK